MSNPYEVYLNQEASLTLIDSRDPSHSTEGFLGKATATWKQIVTPSQRSYFSIESHSFTTEGVFLLSYGRGPCVPVCPAKGDFIPPGYTSVSRDLVNLFRGYEGKRRALRAKIVPMPGERIVNKTLKASSGSFYLHDNRPEEKIMVGWSWLYQRDQAQDRGRYYYYGERVDTYDGVCIPGRTDEHPIAVASQKLRPELFEDNETIRIRVEGTPVSVLIGTDVLTQDEDGLYVWTGTVDDDTLLSVAVGQERVRQIEIL